MSSRPPTMIQPAERTLWTAWTDFWFRPTPLLPLHAQRVLFGLVALLWLLPLAGQVEAFFGLTGWFDTQAVAETAALPESPIDRLSWSPIYWFGADPASLHTVYWGGVVVIVLFTLGLFTRLTGVLTWIVVISFTTNPLIESDADIFLRLFAFYLMIGYLFAGLLDGSRPILSKLVSPLDHWLLAKDSVGRTSFSPAATVALRLIQVHFALAVVSMALHKLQFAEWWSGISYWYPLTRPSEIDPDALRSRAEHPLGYLSGLSVMAYAALVWQLAFPFFAWRRGRARWVLLTGAVAGAAGLADLYRQPLFGAAFLVLCLAYVNADEWERVLGAARWRWRKED